LHALLAGLDDTAAASAANVQRPTLNRWKNHDADFISAMNIARRDLADCFFDGLRALYGDAVAVIRDALNAENPPAVRLRAAEAIIKNIVPPDGETDPEAIRARWAMHQADVAREQEVARFSMPLTAMLD
jgi:succinate dehydrogenase/fumarate reductase flavoprotein subunit